MTKGERIKEIRFNLGMSQTDFADKIGVSKQTLYKYENDIITNIPSDKIENIAKLSNILPSYIMGWEDDSNTITDNIVNLKEEDNKILDSELLMVKKYHCLDKHGKEMVDFVLEKEYERVSNDYVEFAAKCGKYKVKREVAEQWAKQVISDPCERDDDLC